MVLSISVVLHPFPHLMPWKRLLTYNIHNDPMYHSAIPNGSRMERLGCFLKTRPPPIY